MLSRQRIAVSSLQDWGLAALHRAVNATMQEHPSVEGLTEQLQSISQQIELLSCTWWDGVLLDSLMVARLHRTFREGTILQMGPLLDVQRDRLLGLPISGSTLFDGELAKQQFASEVSQRAHDVQMVNALKAMSSKRHIASHLAAGSARTMRKPHQSSSRPLFDVQRFRPDNPPPSARGSYRGRRGHGRSFLQSASRRGHGGRSRPWRQMHTTCRNPPMPGDENNRHTYSGCMKTHTCMKNYIKKFNVTEYSLSG